jgi:CRISPR-associated protein Cas1
MQLVINTYGSYIQKEGDCFKIKAEDKVFDISCKRVSSILISTSALITTDAIKMAIDNNIDIVFLNEFGEPFARIWHSKLGSTVAIRRRQLEVSSSKEGLEMALEWVLRKIENQVNFLERLKKTREEKQEQIQQYINKIKENAEKIKKIEGLIEDKRLNIMSLEGACGKIYFDALSFIMPERFKFEGRSRNPAKDEFNALLNYAYGILYSIVEKCCIIAGLDPYIGFLHSDNYNKKSLVFDLIEMYRIFAEETVVFLFAKREVKVEYFDKVKDGLLLNKEGRIFLIEAFNKNLDETIRYSGRNIKKRDIIQFDLHKIANSLIK